jgi:hypothetical protein
MKKIIIFIILFSIISFSLVAQNNRKEKSVIGPKFPLIESGVSINKQQVVYFSSEMYGSGFLDKVEFSFTKRFKNYEGDTVGCKMPIMLKIYEKDPIKNIPGRELLKDTILIVQQSLNGKTIIDLSKYNIELPQDGIYVGFEAFSTQWYIENGYMTKDNLSYKTNENIGGGIAYHAPMVTASIRKKDVEKYQNFVYGDWAKDWSICNEKYQSTLVIRMHIRKIKN